MKSHPQRILILGSTGLLGQALVKYCQQHQLEYMGVATQTSPAIDVTQPNTVKTVIKSFQPTVVINTVALVNLGQCENNPTLAEAINAQPANYLSAWANTYQYKLIQISTDHYYTGHQNQKHAEDTPVVLLNEYARTKYQAEVFALNHPSSLVVRTNIVGFRGIDGKPTFVEWAIETLTHKKPLKLFHDFYTSSIDVSTFSSLLFELIAKKTTGIINLASHEVTSKQQFVTALAQKLNLDASYAEIGGVFEAPSTIQRAESLGLDVHRAEKVLETTCPTLEQVVTQLAHEYTQNNK